MDKIEEIKRYEKLNKKLECTTRQLTEEEKIKYGLKEKEERKEMNIDLQVDKEFKNLLPPLSPEEFSKLEELIIKDGCTEPLKVWTDSINNVTYIIDGHNRHDICTKHNIQFKVEHKDFSNRYEVIDWIINFQFGRRNLSNEEKYYLSGLQYENEKKGWGGTGANQYISRVVGVTTLLDNESIEDKDNFQSIKTAERIAEQHGLSEKSIRDNGKYANVVNEITELVGVEAKNKILTGEKKISKEDVIELGKQIKSGDIDKEWLNKQFIESNEKKVKIPKKEVIKKELETPEPKSFEQKSIQDPKTKICIKCGAEKNIENDFYIGHEKCKECEISQSPSNLRTINKGEVFKDIQGNPLPIDEEMFDKDEMQKIRDDIKTPKNYQDYVNIDNEIEWTKQVCEDLVDQLDSKFLTLHNIVSKMNDEQILIVIEMLDEHIKEIEQIKIRLLNKGDK